MAQQTVEEFLTDPTPPFREFLQMAANDIISSSSIWSSLPAGATRWINTIVSLKFGFSRSLSFSTEKDEDENVIAYSYPIEVNFPDAGFVFRTKVRVSRETAIQRGPSGMIL